MAAVNGSVVSVVEEADFERLKLQLDQFFLIVMGMVVYCEYNYLAHLGHWED